MENKNLISKQYFTKRLIDLCLKSGMAEFPKNEKDQHILLKSALMMIPSSGNLTEKEINQYLDQWVNNVVNIKTIDRVTMRRNLVDAGYLSRSSDGSRYQLVQPGPHAFTFDPEIDQIDPVEVILNARQEIARRKKEYLDRSNIQ